LKICRHIKTILNKENKSKKKMNIYIGIDPGINGGIAVIHSNSAVAYKMPQTNSDLWELILEIKEISKIEELHIKCCLEAVSSSPQMGVCSAFTFGQGFGHLEMALTAARIPYERVRPQAWQKTMGCLTKGDKNVSKRRAQELFPAIKVTHAIADALLIGEYARRAGK
jgi:Holliday junction resolvasome RuvABC endonuclease subunit